MNLLAEALLRDVQQRARLELLDLQTGCVIVLESLDVLAGRSDYVAPGQAFAVSTRDALDLAVMAYHVRPRRPWQVVGTDRRINVTSAEIRPELLGDGLVCVVVDWR